MGKWDGVRGIFGKAQGQALQRGVEIPRRRVAPRRRRASKDTKEKK